MTKKKKAWHEGIPAPVDADGEPIHIGDVLYSIGNECRVVSITVRTDEACVGVRTDEGVFLPSVNPKYLSRKNTEPLEPEPADSLEKLADDLARYDGHKVMCEYFGMTVDGTCDGCRARSFRAHHPGRSCIAFALDDVASRVRALREAERDVD